MTNAPLLLSLLQEISAVFSINEAEQTEINKMDGTFFMSFDDWFDNFTHVFVAIDFPDEWEGQRLSASWDPELGGNRTVKTWSSNPKFSLTLDSPTEIFVGLSIEDTRLTHGMEYYKTPLQSMPMTFDVVKSAQIVKSASDRKEIPDSTDPDGSKTLQPPYHYQAMQVQTKLAAGRYVIIPSLFRRKVGGKLFFSIYADKPFQLEGGISMPDESKIKNLPGMPKVRVQRARDSCRYCCCFAFSFPRESSTSPRRQGDCFSLTPPLRFC